MRKYIIILLCSACCTGLSCKKWLDVNVNPNDLAEGSVTPNLLLPGILDQLSSDDGYLFYFAFLNRWMGYWCSPYEQSGSNEQVYSIEGEQFFTIFIPGSRLASNIKLMEEKARQADQGFYVGMAKVIKSIVFGNMVDLFNNIPYREAINGTEKRFPAYDKGEFVYTELIKELDSAIFYIKGTELSRNIKISSVDILFRGDKQSWIRFANTLKLRLLIHQANRPDRQAYILEQIAIINDEGSGFLLMNEEASVNPGYNSNNYNSTYSQYAFSQGMPSFLVGTVSANETSLNLLKQNRDPRLPFFYNPIDFDLPPDAVSPYDELPPFNFRGNKYGLSVNPLQYPYQAPPFVSRVGGRTEDGPVTDASSGIFKGYDMDSWLLTSVESMFLQAEAIWRGWVPGNPEQAYKNAVKQSFRWLNVGGSMSDPSQSDAVFDSWYAEEVAAGNAFVSWEAAPDKYRLLMFQKYLALNSIAPLEAWTDYRRNGAFPQIPLSQDPGRVANTMPVRIPYPLQEYQLNSEEVAKEGLINIFTSKIWWMP